ncbi:nitroreductase family protein [Longispora urticae]
MEFSEVLRRRRMVRQFCDRPLTSEVVDKIMASALRAPSAGLTLGWAFLALIDRADRDRLWQFAPNQVPHTPTMRDAPLIVVPMACKEAYVQRYAEPSRGGLSEEDWPAPYWFIDAGMASLSMLLTAVDEGLGAFFFWLLPSVADLGTPGTTTKHLDAFRTEFGVPPEYSPIGAIAIGYRSPDLKPQSAWHDERRKEVGTVFHYGQWGQQTRQAADPPDPDEPPKMLIIGNGR